MWGFAVDMLAAGASEGTLLKRGDPPPPPPAATVFRLFRSHARLRRMSESSRVAWPGAGQSADRGLVAACCVQLSASGCTDVSSMLRYLLKRREGKRREEKRREEKKKLHFINKTLSECWDDTVCTVQGG